jgi:protein TonB
MELTTMVAPVPIQQQPEQQQQQKQETKPAPAEQQVATRTEFVASNLDPTKVPQKVENVASKVPPVPPGGAVLSSRNSDPVGGGAPVGLGTGTGTGSPVGNAPPKQVVVASDDEPPPPPKPTPEPKKNVTISGGVLNGRAIAKPQPPYPAIARAARASGAVVVSVTVDESGKVISAHAVSGNPLLQQAAVQAAYGWRFSPTMLSGQPVKVTGTITFNFTLQ